MITAESVSLQGDKYIGTPYTRMDCQAFWEACLKDAGVRLNLAGSNAWYRRMSWTGTPEECKRLFGGIPKGAALFILKQDGKEPARYQGDGIGNASHIGIYTGRGKGALHSSSSKGQVCESAFAGKTINGGWNRVGLWAVLSYGEKIDKMLSGGAKEATNQASEKTVFDALQGYTGRAVVATANGGTLNVRDGVAGPKKTALPAGTQVTVTRTERDKNGKTWAQITYDATGWVLAEYLEEMR